MSNLKSRQKFHSQREIKGFYMLYLLLAICVVLPYAWSRFQTKKTGNMSNHPNSLNTVVLTNKKAESVSKHSKKPKSANQITTPEKEIFNFKSLTSKEANKIGMPYLIYKRIQNYIKKGGKIRTKEDLLKIYGMDSAIWSRVTPLLKFDSEVHDTTLPTPSLAKSMLAGPTININAATMEQLTALPCIGRKYAERIIKFRDALGGFYALSQLREVYGLGDSTFVCIIPYLYCDGKVRQLSLETATKSQLEKHPYIGWKKAQIIMNYFDAHDRIESADALANIYAFEQEWIEKIRPYIRFTPKKGNISSTVFEEPIMIDER